MWSKYKGLVHKWAYTDFHGLLWKLTIFMHLKSVLSGISTSTIWKNWLKKDDWIHKLLKNFSSSKLHRLRARTYFIFVQHFCAEILPKIDYFPFWKFWENFFRLMMKYSLYLTVSWTKSNFMPDIIVSTDILRLPIRPWMLGLVYLFTINPGKTRLHFVILTV